MSLNRLLPENDFKREYNHIKNSKDDKDKIRLIQAVCHQEYKVTPLQACEFAKLIIDFTKLAELCHSMLECTTNKQDFISAALKLCKYPEDLVVMKKSLGVS
jgi:disulfide oxidoreductase YuzD